MNASSENQADVEQRAPQSFRQRVNLPVSAAVVLCAAVSLCLLVQPDRLAAVVLVPPWCWLVPGVALGVAGCRQNKRLLVAVLGLWTLFAVLFVEEARSLLRVSGSPSAVRRTWRDGGETVRVVSLNCNVGRPHCAEEVAAWNPDVVLLQESPSREALNELSQMLFGDDGEVLHGGDVSILVNGKITRSSSNRSSNFVHAKVELANGFRADVVGLRLAPPAFRLDFWRSGFWSEHRDVRIKHRRQILGLMRRLEGLTDHEHLIVGGDFNSPPYDDALTPLRPLLFDTFQAAGRGWGATGANEYPLFRVDQIWAGRGFQADAVCAQRTVHSDHRMVVCDLTVDR